MLSSSSQIQRWSTDDIDEHSGLVTGWNQRYCQLSCGRFHGSIAVALGTTAYVIRESTNQSLHQSVEPPVGNLVFGLTLSSNGSLHVNRHPVSSSSIVVLEGGKEYDFRTTGQTDMLGLVIEKEQIFGSDGTHAAQVQAALHDGVVALAPHAASLLQNLWQIMSHALDHNQNCSSNISIRYMIETALNNVLLALPFAITRGTKQRTHSATALRQHSVVRQAISFMHIRLGQAFTIGDICAATHVSERTLQYHFESCLGLSPQQYLKAMRLNAARSLIRRLGNSHGARRSTIAEIAAQCGYEHPSRFAGDFRRQFGCLPSESVREVASQNGLTTRAAVIR